MEKLSILLVSALLLVSLFAKYSNRQGEVFITRNSFPASSIKEIETNTMSGNLIINGDAGSKATVEVYVSHDNWSDEKIKQTYEENYVVDIKAENGKLYATVKLEENMSNWDQNGVNVSLRISVPKQLNSNLQTVGGDISISNLSGSQNFKTVGGSLKIENVSDSIGGSIVGGNVTIKNCNGKVDLSTTGGNIDLVISKETSVHQTLAEA